MKLAQHCDQYDKEKHKEQATERAFWSPDGIKLTGLWRKYLYSVEISMKIWTKHNIALSEISEALPVCPSDKSSIKIDDYWASV